MYNVVAVTFCFNFGDKLFPVFILFSNKLSTEKQSAFLRELTDPIKEIWLSEKMQR